MHKSRRTLLKAIGTASAALVPAKTLYGYQFLPAIHLVLNEPLCFSGLADFPSSSPFWPYENVSVCIKQNKNKFVIQIKPKNIAFSGSGPLKFPLLVFVYLTHPSYRLKFTGDLNPTGQLQLTVVFQQLDNDGKVVFQSAPENFSLDRPRLCCHLTNTQLTLSGCQITRAEEKSGKTEVDFNFKANTIPATDLTEIGTIYFDLTFQPSGSVFNNAGVASVDSQGNGVYLDAQGFNIPTSITGETSVRCNIKDFDGFDEIAITTCTTPPKAIT